MAARLAHNPTSRPDHAVACVEHLQVRCKTPMAYASAIRYRPTGPLRDDPAGRLDRPRLPYAGRIGHLSAPDERRDKASGGKPDRQASGGDRRHSTTCAARGRPAICHSDLRGLAFRAAIACREILSGLSSFRRSTNDASTSLCQIGWRLGKRLTMHRHLGQACVGGRRRGAHPRQ
jgi:hypothetical protein